MNQRLTVAADVIFVSRFAFLVSVLYGIKFITVDHMPKQTDHVLYISLKNVYGIYLRCGFTVTCSWRNASLNASATTCQGIQKSKPPQ